MRIYVRGFGCSSSLADAEVLAGCLADAGHTLVSGIEDAELVVFNTCAVKSPTENRMMSLLKKVPREKKLVVAGCLPVINLDRLSREAHFNGVAGPAAGKRIVAIVDQVSKGKRVVDIGEIATSMPSLGLPRARVNPRIGIIPINYGCFGACAYCCVRFARGKLRSHLVSAIASRVEKDFSDGVREFWLTSQDTACYGKDQGTDLAELLKRVCGVDGDFFVRVGMMTPNNILGILAELLDAFKDEKVFKFLHVPVQSGDDDVLRRMNRLYTVDDFLEVISEFRRKFPHLTVATDVIVGFPGETEEAFRNTRRLVEDIRPDIVNISKFFARPRTSAAKMKQRISPSIIKRRSASLASLVRRVSLDRNALWKGWSGAVLVDEVGKASSVVGRNFAYKPVVMKGRDALGLLGQFVVVEITEAFRSHLVGRIV